MLQKLELQVESVDVYLYLCVWWSVISPWGMVLRTCQWIGYRENLKGKPWVLPSNTWGFSSKISLKPIRLEHAKVERHVWKLRFSIVSAMSVFWGRFTAALMSSILPLPLLLLLFVFVVVVVLVTMAAAIVVLLLFFFFTFIYQLLSSTIIYYHLLSSTIIYSII